MNRRSWIIRDLLKVSADYLEEKGIESPRLSAEILLAHQLGVSRVNLYLHLDKPLNSEEVSGYRSLIKRRLNREPIQYITGKQEFWSLDFIVGPQVLVPRPESELLVEEAIKLYKNKDLPVAGYPKILDLGTGSGAIAVSLAREFEKSSIWASDISEEALGIAGLNAKRHGVEDRVKFIQGDLWEPFSGKKLTFDIIISNPPYIKTDAFDSLPPEVKDYEPREALDGHGEGMSYIEKILEKGADYLNPGGWLLLEMDPEQTSKALILIEESDRYGERKRLRDYAGMYRVVSVRKKVSAQ